MGDVIDNLLILVGLLCCLTYVGYPMGMPLIVVGYGGMIVSRLDKLNKYLKWRQEN